ncbi:HNH endonuclease [compost metagenome]
MSMDRKPLQIGPLEGKYFDNYPDYLSAVSQKEAEAFENFRDYLAENADLLSYVSRQGDGEGGALIRILKEALFDPPTDRPKAYRKAKIHGALRTAVFERDAYRCKRCGSYKDLCADHIYPEVLGGETTFENLQTLCRPCNASKGSRVEPLQ